MKKKVIITGSTGMVGGILLQSCLNCNVVDEVIALVRKPTQRSNEKYKEVIVDDFLDYHHLAHLFSGVDVVFYCLGVYTGAVPAEEFRKSMLTTHTTWPNPFMKNHLTLHFVY